MAQLRHGPNILHIPGMPTMAIGHVKAAGGATDSDAQAFIDGLDAPPGDPYESALHAFVISAKANGYWTKMYGIWCFALDTESNSLFDMKHVGGTKASTVSGMVWSDSVGFTGDGSADYLALGVVADQISPYTLDDACWACYNHDSGGDVWGQITSVYIVQFLSATVLQSRINTGTNASGLTLGTGVGLKAAVRTGSTASEFFEGSTSVGTSTQASTSLGVGKALHAGRTFNKYLASGKRISFTAVGSSLTSTELGNMETDMATYLAAVAP